MMPDVPSELALRVRASIRHGSSWPVVIETSRGDYFAKLRGAAQGTSALVAEIVVAELAERLSLAVPRRQLIRIEKSLPSADPHGELRQLLDASVGLNLGFELIKAARNLTLDEIERVPLELRARIVWLDALVLNVDRTSQNPNLMLQSNRVWLIDHGAALTFQHDWRNVREQTPRETGGIVERHLFQVPDALLWKVDQELAPRLPREALTAALAAVPDDFLLGLPAWLGTPRDLERERAAYVAFLWKRLKSPRPFLSRRPFDL
ncbi:MAG: HipA family kinase [Myxococcota bacterium]